jgi:hypothetical protein
MRRLIVIALITAPAAAGAQDWMRERPPPKEGYAYPDCLCSNRGAMEAVGALACLEVGGRRFTARCEMSVNIPTWRFVEEGCRPGAISRASPASAPAAPG